ncbi:alpha/beta fold hydrolase [Sinimarinibacterium sp. NLF-5-8]|uniref:alpha/beta fold hydrolase n=1 Tax=Sinimarinibacterium sp. NLF-5-8 TaxID=2698684 RepID=UPI00137BC4B9|nr:alpha/beta fold hydrolase [Sinimarinibacterium sp. NLF-5-8]QHS09515.1 peptidase S15 [Sinimarinibacterium sp. NLF-5-8]
MLRPVLIAATALLLLSGCGTQTGDATPIASVSGQTAHAVVTSRAGRVYRQEIPSEVTGDTTVVQVFEPTQLVAGQTYPLILEGHGYGGSRQTTAPDGSFIKRLNDAGYYVISIDQRGFGESSGTVRVMDPDFEGQNLIAVLDWAENLEGLRRRSNGEMVVGSYGGSYGGMYQFLLAGADPRQRLRVIAPDITPHDLLYALNPNDAIKSGWALALVAGGEASGLTGLFSGRIPTGLNQDMTVVETLLKGGLTNTFPETGRNYFGYHSVRYFCDGVSLGEQNFLLGQADTYQVPPRAFAQIDALITQGFRDTLFNFNDGLNNYDCLRARGGDVRLLSHQSGHILPLTTAPLEGPLDPFYTALTLPNFQDGGGNGNCGSIDLQEARFAWFEEKLQNRGNANAVITTQDSVCLSLADDDAISVPAVQRGGTAFFIDSKMPQLNSVLGIVGSLLGNLLRETLVATQPLTTVGDSGAVLAGVPLASIDLLPLTGGLLEQDQCLLPILPLGCDPILYLGIGHRKAGTQRWDLIDDQITPIRGFGHHQVEMTGIAERLAAGDELALLVYGFHLQYPITWSRDLLIPALKISGRIDLPLLAEGSYRAVP